MRVTTKGSKAPLDCRRDSSARICISYLLHGRVRVVRVPQNLLRTKLGAHPFARDMCCYEALCCKYLNPHALHSGSGREGTKDRAVNPPKSKQGSVYFRTFSLTKLAPLADTGGRSRCKEPSSVLCRVFHASFFRNRRGTLAGATPCMCSMYRHFPFVYT